MPRRWGLALSLTALRTVLLCLVLLALLDACLSQDTAVLTDANFKQAVAACLGEDPVAGNCVNSPFGPISGWDTSRVTDMAGHWQDADGNWHYESASLDT
eukprot:SAG31_NODE_8663_length_1410_cov_54.086194_1_plen_100_part_00